MARRLVSAGFGRTVAAAVASAIVGLGGPGAAAAELPEGLASPGPRVAADRGSPDELAVPTPPRDLALDRRSPQFGFDFRLGLPTGVLSLPLAVGADAVATPTPGLDIAAGIEASGIVVGFRGAVTASPVRWWKPHKEWSPSVGVGYTALLFTQTADEVLERFAPGARDDLADVGTDVTFSGVRLHTLSMRAGVDFQKRPHGFHFRFEIGRVRMVGPARGGNQNPEETVVIEGYQSWTFSLTFGWRR